MKRFWFLLAIFCICGFASTGIAQSALLENNFLTVSYPETKMIARNNGVTLFFQLKRPEIPEEKRQFSDGSDRPTTKYELKDGTLYSSRWKDVPENHRIAIHTPFGVFYTIKATVMSINVEKDLLTVLMQSGVGVHVCGAKERYKLMHVSKESFVDVVAPVPLVNAGDSEKDKKYLEYNFSNMVELKTYLQDGRFFIDSRVPNSEKTLDKITGALGKLVKYIGDVLKVDTKSQEQFKPTEVPAGKPMDQTPAYAKIISGKPEEPVFLNVLESYFVAQRDVVRTTGLQLKGDVDSSGQSCRLSLALDKKDGKEGGGNNGSVFDVCLPKIREFISTSQEGRENRYYVASNFVVATLQQYSPGQFRLVIRTMLETGKRPDYFPIIGRRSPQEELPGLGGQGNFFLQPFTPTPAPIPFVPVPPASNPGQSGVR